MVTTYNIGSPSAEIKLTAIMAAHGGVVYDSIAWELHDSDENKPNHVLYKSGDSQASLLVKPGYYRVFIQYAGEMIDCGLEELEKNTSTDRVYILNDDGLFDETKQYEHYHLPNKSLQKKRVPAHRQTQQWFHPRPLERCPWKHQL